MTFPDIFLLQRHLNHRVPHSRHILHKMVLLSWCLPHTWRRKHESTAEFAEFNASLGQRKRESFALPRRGRYAGATARWQLPGCDGLVGVEGARRRSAPREPEKLFHQTVIRARRI